MDGRRGGCTQEWRQLDTEEQARVLDYCNVRGRTGCESRGCCVEGGRIVLVVCRPAAAQFRKGVGVHAEAWSPDLASETREMREGLVRRRRPGKSTALPASPVRWYMEHAHNRPTKWGSIVDRDARAEERV